MKLPTAQKACNKLVFQLVNFENVKEAIRTQNEIFPEDDGTLHILMACDVDSFTQNSGLSIPINKVNYYLAFWDCEIVGITGLYTYAETGTPNECWLAWYGVREQFRGQGYGKEILDWTKRKAAENGYDVLRLYTTESYSQAVKIYEKQGFISEPYTLEPGGFIVYSIALTEKPLKLLNGRFINITPEIELCNISIERKKEIIVKYDGISKGVNMEHICYKKIDFKKADDYEIFKSFYNSIYVRAFENEDERESLDSIINQNGRFRQLKTQIDAEHYCIVAVMGNKPVGGLIANVFVECHSSFMEFIAVDELLRSRGIGDGLIKAFKNFIDSDFGFGSVLHFFFEVENPYKMPEAIFDSCMKRIRHWVKRGAKRVSIDYLQPALSSDKSEVDYLYLCYFANPETMQIEANILRAALECFFSYAFVFPKNKIQEKIQAMLPSEVETVALIKMVRDE